MTEQDVGVAFATLATALAAALHRQGVADGQALLAEAARDVEAVVEAGYPAAAAAILSACARSLRAAEA
ncbi:hypothetical protein [Methylobacterium crusticola]|nr:hypothetical protein [Methylobacterium crusticola]